jgi:hypothetical protein
MKDTFGFAAMAAIVGFGLMILYGWVMNIVALVGMDWAAGVSIEALLRIAGIFIMPLGAIMGVFV